MQSPRTNVSAQRIEIIRSFFSRFDCFKAHEKQSRPVIREFLEQFTVELPKLREREQNWRKETAPDFNVFRALHLERRETKLHSRFLAELLDPNGIHGQGERFLTEFIDLAKRSGLRSPSEWPEANYGARLWEITTEEAVNEYDRLDVVLRCEKAKFITVIENKIDAAEGTEQLLRYDQWLEEQRRFDFRNLVFLTPDGREPKTVSIDRCLCLSYREHVTSWLRQLVDQIQAIHLRFAINQYLELLPSL